MNDDKLVRLADVRTCCLGDGPWRWPVDHVDYPVPREVWDPAYRKKPAPKSAEEMAEIRSRACRAG